MGEKYVPILLLLLRSSTTFEGFFKGLCRALIPYFDRFEATATISPKASGLSEAPPINPPSISG